MQTVTDKQGNTIQIFTSKRAVLTNLRGKITELGTISGDTLKLHSMALFKNEIYISEPLITICHLRKVCYDYNGQNREYAVADLENEQVYGEGFGSYYKLPYECEKVLFKIRFQQIGCEFYLNDSDESVERNARYAGIRLDDNIPVLTKREIAQMAELKENDSDAYWKLMKLKSMFWGDGCEILSTPQA